jgi:DNA modification methylase
MAINCLDEAHGDSFTVYQGDCCDVLRQFPDNSIGFSIYSPPFGSIFVYSASAADMGNSGDDEEFYKHYEFLIAEMARVTKPGRLTAVHCSELPYKKWVDGYIGLKDFPGEIIRIHQRHGFVLHSRVTIWRCPVVEMTRTKALGLLYKQLQKDSTKSRQGMADYLLVFRAAGENENPVGHKPADFPVDRWQQWASPVWMDINQTNTLNVRIAKENKDEKHLCPLQLDLIERALVLWSNPGDVVLSPFMGIGSEGYEAVKAKRRFVGIELKESYFRQAVKNLERAEANLPSLFDGLVLEAAE